MWISNIDSSPRPASREDASGAGDARGRGGAGRAGSRGKRRLISSLRKLAMRRPGDAGSSRFEVLLADRLPPVRDDLLEIAALLEQTSRPNPGCVATLRRLLTDGCESPLYNPEVHPSELRATLYYVRSRLIAGY